MLEHSGHSNKTDNGQTILTTHMGGKDVRTDMVTIKTIRMWSKSVLNGITRWTLLRYTEYTK